MSTIMVGLYLIEGSILTIKVLARMIRTIVLNENNFKTLIHHIHKLKDLRYVNLAFWELKDAKYEQQCLCMQST